MCLLILGGTAEAKTLAKQLYAPLAEQQIDIIYSVAGLVRQPELPCSVLSGGFSQYGGLEECIKQHAVAAILDVTHPFAQKMSATAARAAKHCGIAYWAYQRPQWQAQSGDDWHMFKHWPDVLAALAEKKSVMLSAGQMQAEQVQYLTRYREQKQLLRTAVELPFSLPEQMTYIKAIGPFALADELALMQAQGVDVLVSKMSGGAATEAKLLAARALGIPVYFLQRPEAVSADKVFTTIESCIEFVAHQFVRDE